MKADLSRVTFESRQHFAGLLHQQQRVLLDADLNEQQQIARYRVETQARDELGPCATPIDFNGAATGFALAVNAAQDDVTIGIGHYYIGGMLAENEGRNGQPIPASAQPDLPANGSPIVPAPGAMLGVPAASNNPPGKLVALDAQGKPIPPADGIYLGFVEVWQHHVTALEQPALRETALGGPDTATRIKTVWQVKLLRVDPNPNAALNCSSPMQPWLDHFASYRATGRLAAQAEPTKPPKGPCVIAPKAGYRRLENQLYRVEVHQSGVLPGSLRYKWSRDNGSIVVRALSVKGAEITVSTLGRDKVLNIAAGKWVELTDDTRELLGQPGLLLEVLKAQDDVVTVKLSANVVLNLADYPANAKLRRWDGVEDASTAWSTLEDGIEVKFAAGLYNTGDYWQIPARTASGSIEWPRDGANPAAVERNGIAHHFCKLGVLKCASGKWSVLDDCRPQFPALTDLVGLFYVGGDGQEAMPDPLQLQNPVPLAQPLQVGVANGQWPVANATVRFTITSGNGQLQNTNVQSVDVVTNAQGVATCAWSMDATTAVQSVEAQLLEGGAPANRLPVRFSGRLARAQDVAYDPAQCAALKAAAANTVQKAIDELCKQGHGGGCCTTIGPKGEFPTLFAALKTFVGRGIPDMCFCLLPGDHMLDEWPREQDWPKITDELRGAGNITIAGCGPGSRLIIQRVPLSFAGWRSVSLASFDMVGREQREPLISVKACSQVAIRDMRLLGNGVKIALVQVGGAQRIQIERNVIEAYLPNVLDQPFQIIDGAGPLDQYFHGMLTKDHLEFLRGAQEAVKGVLQFTQAARAQQAAVMTQRVNNAIGVGAIHPVLVDAARSLIELYANPDLDLLCAAFSEFRLATPRARPANALAILDAQADTVLSGNRCIGLTTLCGAAGPLAPLDLDGIRTAVRNARLRLRAGNGRLEMTDNELSGVILGREAKQAIQAAVTAGRPVPGLFRNAQVSGNRMMSTPNEFIAVNAHFSDNTFDVRPAPVEMWSVAERSTFLGNVSIDEFQVQVRIVAGTPAPQLVGINPLLNVGLNFNVLQP